MSDAIEKNPFKGNSLGAVCSNPVNRQAKHFLYANKYKTAPLGKTFGIVSVVNVFSFYSFNVCVFFLMLA